MKLVTLWSLVFLMLGSPPKHHRVVIEFTGGEMPAIKHVLANVANLAKAYPGEPTDIEVVCHDGGIALLLQSSQVIRNRLLALSKEGVRFVACKNSLLAYHVNLNLLPSFAKVVPSGVAEVVNKEEAGWSYLKGPS